MKNTKTLAIYGLLTAVIILMTFTPLGYLKTLGVEITFLTIPVMVGAIVLGPSGGAILGGVFGLTSFLQCFGLSPFGASLLTINPIYTFIMCMVPRILMGLLAGLIFKSFKNKDTLLPYLISSASGAVLNTLFFVLTLILLFGQTEYIQTMRGENSLIKFLALFVGINGVVEALVTAVAGSAIGRAVYKFTK